jgi:hypothetical protein
MRKILIAINFVLLSISYLIFMVFNGYAANITNMSFTDNIYLGKILPSKTNLGGVGSNGSSYNLQILDNTQNANLRIEANGQEGDQIKLFIDNSGPNLTSAESSDVIDTIVSFSYTGQNNSKILTLTSPSQTFNITIYAAGKVKANQGRGEYDASYTVTACACTTTSCPQTVSDCSTK